MANFETWRSYKKFANIVKNKNRYIYDDKVANFLEVVCKTSSKREELIKEGANLWRAQRGCDSKPTSSGEIKKPVPYSCDRMTPLEGQANEGRANPKGIPYLYLANEKETALAEVRPGLDSYISLGLFKLKKEIKIINCSEDIASDDKITICFSEPDDDTKEEIVWSDINEAFSKPVSRSDKKAEYIPTQILAELFKEKGFDGIAYKSSYGSGVNLVLFDLDVVNLLECYLFELEDIDFNFKKSAGKPRICDN